MYIYIYMYTHTHTYMHTNKDLFIYLPESQSYRERGKAERSSLHGTQVATMAGAKSKPGAQNFTFVFRVIARTQAYEPCLLLFPGY